MHKMLVRSSMISLNFLTKQGWLYYSQLFAVFFFSTRPWTYFTFNPTKLLDLSSFFIFFTFRLFRFFLAIFKYKASTHQFCRSFDFEVCATPNSYRLSHEDIIDDICLWPNLCMNACCYTNTWISYKFPWNFVFYFLHLNLFNILKIQSNIF